MEATGDYWKPFYYLLEDAGFEVMLVNARQVKNLPGRKSDVSDAVWLAQLGAHGCRIVRAAGGDPQAACGPDQDPDPHDPETGRRSNGWRSCWKTPGSSCPASPPDITGVSERPMLQALIERQDRPRHARRPGQAAAPGQDPRVDRGARLDGSTPTTRSWRGCTWR